MKYRLLFCMTLPEKGKRNFLKVDRLIEKRKVGHVSTTCQNKMFSWFISFSVIFWDEPKTCLFFYCQNKEYLAEMPTSGDLKSGDFFSILNPHTGYPTPPPTTPIKCTHPPPKSNFFLNENNNSFKNGIRPFNFDYHPNNKTTERQYHKNIQMMTSMFGPRLTRIQLWPNKWNEKL